MTMTDAELAEIQARAEAATPGEWWVMPDYEDPVLYVETTSHGGYFVCGLDDNRPNDAAFIAHARTDIPALLDELAAARGTLQSLWLEYCELHDRVLKELGSDPSVGAQAQKTHPAAIYLHSATEDADDRTT